jgi:hypothetical protein
VAVRSVAHAARFPPRQDRAIGRAHHSLGDAAEQEMRNPSRPWVPITIRSMAFSARSPRWPRRRSKDHASRCAELCPFSRRQLRIEVRLRLPLPRLPETGRQVPVDVACISRRGVWSCRTWIMWIDASNCAASAFAMASAALDGGLKSVGTRSGRIRESWRPPSNESFAKLREQLRAECEMHGALLTQGLIRRTRTNSRKREIFRPRSPCGTLKFLARTRRHRNSIQFIVLVLSLSVHEAAHAWSADRLGDPTARRLGRVSLNPAVHVDPIGTIVFPCSRWSPTCR